MSKKYKFIIIFLVGIMLMWWMINTESSLLSMNRKFRILEGEKEYRYGGERAKPWWLVDKIDALEKEVKDLLNHKHTWIWGKIKVE